MDKPKKQHKVSFQFLIGGELINVPTVIQSDGNLTKADYAAARLNVEKGLREQQEPE